MNKIITERAWSVRLHAGYSSSSGQKYLNPLVPLNKGLSEEAWSGKNVSLSHLRVIRESSYFVTFIDNYIRKV